MSVKSFLIALQATHVDGQTVTKTAFIDPLQIHPNDPVEFTSADGGRWQAGLVYFPLCRFSEFAGQVDPHEKLFAKLAEIQQRVAVFLDAREIVVFENMRRMGLQVRIFAEVRMDEDQMEFPFDASFIAACGRHRLPIFVMSNDITVAEIERSRK